MNRYALKKKKNRDAFLVSEITASCFYNSTVYDTKSFIICLHGIFSGSLPAPVCYWLMALWLLHRLHATCTVS